MIGLKYGNELFSEFIKSKEFGEYKNSILSLNNSIESKDIDFLFRSFSKLEASHKEMKNRVFQLLLYITERHLPGIDLNKIRFRNEDDLIVVYYNEYIPSYKNEVNQYESVNVDILSIDYNKKTMKIFYLKENYLKADKCKKQDLLNLKVKIDVLKNEINEMKLNSSSKIEVIKSVKNHLETIGELETKLKTYFYMVKILLSTTKFIEIKSFYMDMVAEKEEDLKVYTKELNKEENYSYIEIYDEISHIQKHIAEKISKFKFKYIYDHESQKEEFIQQKEVSIIPENIDLEKLISM